MDNRGNYRLDGTLPIVNLIDLPLEDKDRVEALKGASALYYGFTTPSGIINLTMKRPTHAPFVDSDTFGDDNGGVGEHVDANDWWGIFGARLNAVYAKVDSGIDNTEGQRALLSGAFDIRPTDKLAIQVDLEHIEKTVPEPTVFLLAAPKSTAANLYPADQSTAAARPEHQSRRRVDEEPGQGRQRAASRQLQSQPRLGADVRYRHIAGVPQPPILDLHADQPGHGRRHAEDLLAERQSVQELTKAASSSPARSIPDRSSTSCSVGVSKNVRRQFNANSTSRRLPGADADVPEIT